MAAATAPVRRIEAREFSDDELLAAGIVDEDQVEFDHDPVPGEVIFDYNVDGTSLGRFDGTMTGDDPTHVAIYDINGRRFGMPKDWAVMRLQKRYPRNHAAYPGQPVFYKRPPVAFPAATIKCQATWDGGCRKMLHSERQARAHFKNRHESEFKEFEEDRNRDLQERSIKAQERQAELMERLLGGAAPVTNAAAVEAVLAEAPMPVTEPEPELPEGEAPEGVPDSTWKRADLMAWLKGNQLPTPENWIKLSQEAVWEHVKGLLEA